MLEEDEELALAVTKAISLPRILAALWGQAMAMQTAAMGLGILLPGERHFAAPSYAVALDAMPWWAWGTLFLSSGITMAMMVWRRPQSALLAAIPAALAYGFLAATLARALWLLPTASGAAVVNYGGLAVMVVLAGWVVGYVQQQWPR